MKKFFTTILLTLLLNQINAQQEFYGKWYGISYNTTIDISCENNKTVIKTILNDTGEVIKEKLVTYSDETLRSTLNYKKNNWSVNKIYTFYNKNKIAVNYNNKEINTTVFFKKIKNKK